MRNTDIAIKSHSAPISQALQRIHTWIERDKSSRLLVVAHSQKELICRDWPEHVEVSSTKTPGRRVAVRGPRRNALARWPDDAYEASLQPHLACVIKNRVALNLADYVLHCQEGDWIFVPPGIAHGVQSHLPPESKEGQCDILWFRPDPQNTQLYLWICHSEYQRHESGPEYGTCQVESPLLLRQFSSLSEELQSANDNHLIYHLLTGMILILRREMEQGRAFLPQHHQADLHASSENQYGTIEQACSYIDKYLAQSLTASQVARHVCMSKTLFHRNFRLQTGHTFHVYLTMRRLEKSSVLLRETDIEVNAISRMVGLHYSQLRRLYYEHYQCTPGEFRKEWVRRNSSHTKVK